MSRKTKTIITTILLTMALFQGPYFYYFTSGFVKLVFLLPFAVTGLLLSIILLFNLITHRSINSSYHIAGLIIAVIIGLYTSVGRGMESIDFNIRLDEREKIVEQIKNRPVKAGNIIDQIFFRLSDGGEVSYTKTPNGAVHVEFYIDRGFLDHYSSFVYTNDPNEIGPDNNVFVNTKKKLKDNWYRMAY